MNSMGNILYLPTAVIRSDPLQETLEDFLDTCKKGAINGMDIILLTLGVDTDASQKYEHTVVVPVLINYYGGKDSRSIHRRENEHFGTLCYARNDTELKKPLWNFGEKSPWEFLFQKGKEYADYCASWFDRPEFEVTLFSCINPQEKRKAEIYTITRKVGPQKVARPVSLP